jgi:NAD(P)-dependent dehydrogenase (short-subunit alcohol dehydrogenase family)
MGGEQSAIVGAKYTAKHVVELFGTGQYLTGKTAIVTGGNSGIGLEACKALSSAGARVILCSRSVASGEKAVKEEVKTSGHGGYTVETPDIVVKQLDLENLDSIKTFADDFIANEKSLDFLILNAGIMALPNLERTSVGLEKQIGVNHFGHFYLTSLLRNFFTTQNKPVRIVSLSSSAHSMGSVNTNDLNFEHGRK